MVNLIYQFYSFLINSSIFFSETVSTAKFMLHTI